MFGTELLLMGFLSLLLARLQDEIVRVCIPPSWALKGLPCNLSSDTNVGTTTRYSTGRHLLAEDVAQSYCQQKGKVPLISYHALHDLHILIFVLAVTHAVVCAFTMLFGAMKISRWKAWEKSIIDEIHCAETDDENDAKAVDIKKDDFIKSRYLGDQARKRIWLQSFAKHLYCPVSESDYAAMRTGFVMTHCGGNLKFSFYEYMMRVFEADFAKVISISGFVWVIVVISLLLNLAGWHMYFWIAFLPLIVSVGGFGKYIKYIDRTHNNNDKNRNNDKTQFNEVHQLATSSLQSH